LVPKSYLAMLMDPVDEKKPKVGMHHDPVDEKKPKVGMHTCRLPVHVYNYFLLYVNVKTNCHIG